ncbi:hypothetical protein [Nocardioides sp.]|uniref:hypothetical protein n=1 Tax=Nocardioides sp. TaxID=35761 RepID=UPI003518050E
MRTRLHTTLPTLTALLLALSACTSSPAPKPPPLEPSDTAGSTSPRPTDPVASDLPPETAEEFVVRWQVEAFRMQQTGDTSQYLAMSRECRQCSDLADSVTSIYREGGEIEVELPKIEDLSLVGTPGKVTILEYDLETAPTVVRDSQGEVDQRFPGGVERFQVNVVRSRGGWFIVRFGEVDRA